jgi:hypothetical protein
MDTNRESRIASRLVKAGDEWVDDETNAFAKELAKVMKSDKSVGRVGVRGNVIQFTFSPTILVEVPMDMTIKEFGYGEKSESVNGTITSPEQSSFRLPGGYTRTRDPKKMWKRAKENLMDIFKRAMG